MLNVRKGCKYLCIKDPDRYSDGFGRFHSGNVYIATDEGIIRGEHGIDVWVTWECEDFIEVQ